MFIEIAELEFASYPIDVKFPNEINGCFDLEALNRVLAEQIAKFDKNLTIEFIPLEDVSSLYKLKIQEKQKEVKEPMSKKEPTQVTIKPIKLEDAQYGVPFYLWGVFTPEDNTEGRGPLELLSVFDDESQATLYAEGKGPMGVEAALVKPVKVIQDVHGIVHLIERTAPMSQLSEQEKLKLKALAKLTREEKVALGL